MSDENKSSVETVSDSPVAHQRLVKRRQQLLDELKKVREAIRAGEPGKTPLPKDGQKVWIINNKGKRRFKATFYHIGSPLQKVETTNSNWGCRCSPDIPRNKHKHWHLVVKSGDEWTCCDFKRNFRAPNGGWQAA